MNLGNSCKNTEKDVFIEKNNAKKLAYLSFCIYTIDRINLAVCQSAYNRLLNVAFSCNKTQQRR